MRSSASARCRRGLRLEARATAGDRTFLKSYFAAWVSSLIQFWCERFDRRARSYNAPVYRDEIRSNTDFRKYGGILRMVLDVSENQAERIEDPADIGPAFQRARRITEEGAPVLLEFVTSVETRFSLRRAL